MKKIKIMLAMLLAAMYLMPSFLYAQTDESERDFVYDGIIYTVIDEEAKTCRTKAGIYSRYNNDYEPANNLAGDVVLPSNPSDGESTFTLTEIGNGSFANNFDLKSMVVPSTVTSMGEFAFRSCKSLEKIELPESLREIPEYSFCRCSSLTKVSIPKEVRKIGMFAFYGCLKLSKVECSNYVNTIEAYAFIDCPFKSFIFPKSLKTIGYEAFARCDQLEGIDLPSTVRTMDESAFYECRGLKWINLSSSLTEIKRGTFYNAGADAGIESLTIPSSVIRICDGYDSLYEEEYGAFHGINAKSIYLPDDMEVIGDYAFKDSSVENITLPSNLRWVGYKAFEGCANLKNIYYNTTDPADEQWYGDKIFDEETYFDATLYVAVGGKDKADETEPWCYFWDIVEYDFSGVGMTADDYKDSATEVFDLQGRKVADGKDGLSDGVYIIREGGKVRKTIVKH